MWRYILGVIILSLTASAWATTDNFERTGPSLGVNWAAHSDLIIQNGRLHNQSSTAGWNTFLAVFNETGNNRAAIQWPDAGNGVDATGSELGGIAIVDAFSAASDGYFVYLYSGELRLYEIADGQPSVQIQTKNTQQSVSPGDQFKVQWDAQDHEFKVYINDTLVETLVDASARIALGNAYAGVMLFGGDAYQNDVEAFSVDFVQPVVDNTAPSAIGDLDATTMGANSILLSWTASGDDGNSGTASLYDIRYSTQSILTDTDFENANQVVGVSSPKQAGQSESKLVDGLDPSTTYFFAVKVRDEEDNWSALSNEASATTDEDGGGGGGGDDPAPVIGACTTDEFDRVDLGSFWATTGNQVIESGELTLASPTGGWSNVMLYQKSGALSVSAMFSATNSELYDNRYIPAGLIILADNADPNVANSYLLLRQEDGVAVYTMAPGANPNRVQFVNGSQAKPLPGDVIRADIQDNGLTKTVTFYINGDQDAQFDINNGQPLADMYAGVSQHGSYQNNFDFIKVCFEGGDGPIMLETLAGNNQSGPIQSQLPEPLQVRVTTAQGEPYEGALLDFQVVNGEAVLNDIENFQFDGRVWVEVEDGRIKIPIASVEDDGDASSGQYVTSSWTPGYRYERAVEIPFYVPERANYDVYLRYRSPDDGPDEGGAPDGAYISVDNLDSTYFEVATPQANWSWHEAENYTLDRGSHTLNLIIYEPSWDWDKLLIQKSSLGPPSGMGGTGPQFPNMTDAEGIAETRVTFGTNADDNVIVEVRGNKQDGSPLEGSPASFTLDPLAGPAVSMERDPDMPQDPISAVPGLESPALRVLVKDTYGNRKAGTMINWEITQGEGTLASDQVESDQFGVASNTLTLGYQAENYIIQAYLAELSGSPVSFTIEPTEPPHSMQLVSPTKVQQANNQTTLDSLLTVRILKEDQSPFEGFPVNFVVTNGGGKISSPEGDERQDSLSILTDGTGYARAKWTLGAPGLNQVEARGNGLEGAPAVFQANAITGAPDSLVKVSGDEQDGYVGMPLAEPLLVKLIDTNGFPVAEQQIRFEIMSPTAVAYFDQPGQIVKNIYTDQNGEAEAVLSMGSQINQEHLIRVEALDTDIDPVYFRAMPVGRIANKLSYFSGNGTMGSYQTGIVTQELDNAFTVKATDPFGNAVPGQDITFRVVDGGGSFDGSDRITVQTNSGGLASATLTLGQASGDSNNVVQASAFRVDLPSEPLSGSPVVFKASALPKPAAKIIKIDSTDEQQGEVGLSLEYPLQVRVLDVHDNPIPDHPVTFNVQGSGGKLEDSGGKGTSKVIFTKSDGYASILWHMPETPGVYAVDAVSRNTQGNPLSGSPISFSARANVGKAYSMKRINSDSLFTGTVGTLLDENIIVQIVDRFDNPIIGYPVTFKVKEGNGLLNGLSQVTVPTADLGYAEIEWLLGTEAGVNNNVVEASAAVDESNKLLFTASANPGEAFRLEADSAFVHVGTVGSTLPQPARVQVVDQYGNGVSDRTVNFSLEAVNGNIGYLGQPGVTIATRVTDAEGYAQVSWTIGPRVGSLNNRLSVSSKRNNKNLENSPYVFEASALVGPPHKLVKITNDTTKDLSGIINNTLSEFLRVQVVDEYNNPISNHSVRFEVLSRRQADGGSLDGKVDSVKVKETNSNGLVSVQFTLGKEAGVRINRVQVSTYVPGTGQHLVNSPLLFEISGRSTNATQMAKEDGDGQTGTVGKNLSRPIKVKAMDQHGNKVEGQPINFRIALNNGDLPSEIGALGSGTTTDTTVDTDNEGIASIVWRMGHKTGEYTLTATSTDLDGSPATFTATAEADVTHPDSSIILVTPSSQIVSEGEQRSMVRVTLMDRFNNPVQNKAVSLEATGECQVVQPNGSTDENGQTVGYIYSEKSGVKQITARDINNGITLNTRANIIFYPGEASNLVKPVTDHGDDQQHNVGTVLPKPLKAIVTDQYENRIPNIPVTFAVTSGGGSVVEPQPIRTDSTGVAACQVRLGEEAGPNTVTASAAGLTGSPLRYTEVAEEPEQVVQLLKISGDHLIAAPNQELDERLGVRVLDANGWPVYNEKVKFEVLHNNGSIVSGNPVQSDMYGEAHARALVGTRDGLNIYRATLTNYPHITATFYDTTRASAGSGAAKIQYVSGDDQETTVGQTLLQPFVVKVVDQYGNAISDARVTFSVVEDNTVQSSGTLEGGVSDLTKFTNEQGRASAYYTVGMNFGLNLVRVSSPNLEPEFIEFSAMGLGDTPYSMEKLSGDGQVGEMGKVLLYPVKVRIYDRHGNPSRGGQVSFYVTQGGGSVVESQPVTSNINGIAQVHWKLGPRPGSVDNTLEAVADLAGGSYIETFTAQGDASYWPELQLPAEKTVVEGDKVSFQVSATDGDGDDLFYNALDIPADARFTNNNDDTHTFEWTPGNDVVESPETKKTIYTVFEVTDIRGGKDIDSVKITVKDYNQAPMITNFWPTDLFLKPDLENVNQLEFGIQATDPDGDVITTTWYVDDEFYTYGQVCRINLNELEFGQRFEIRVRVCDQGMCDEKSWTLLTTQVELSNLEAQVVPYKGVQLIWETSSESGNAGFNVLRSNRLQGDYKKINTNLIQSSPNGKYEFVDESVEAGHTVYYKLQDVTVDGFKNLHGPVKAETPLPDAFNLQQNFPNPFNPITTIRYELPKPVRVRINIYNVLGQKVKTLVDREMRAGFHSILWNAESDAGVQVASGIYYFRMVAGNYSKVRKMVVLK
ncbi:MAG: Ig-like domain-containing protein [candidate division KSB1 bacterium]|nr:Ig-like domain-containing protein [candidate division KSB1 bacterium]